MARTAPLLPTLRPYLLAAVASFLALVLASVASPYAESAPLLAFLTAVALSAWYGGPGPGLLATAFGTAALSVFFAADVPYVAFLSADAVLDLVVFAAAATALSLLARNLRTALAQADAARTASREAHDRLSVILDGIGDGVMVQDRSGRLIYANGSAAQASGYSSAAAVIMGDFKAVVLGAAWCGAAQGPPKSPQCWGDFNWVALGTWVANGIHLSSLFSLHPSLLVARERVDGGGMGL